MAVPATNDGQCGGAEIATPVLQHAAAALPRAHLGAHRALAGTGDTGTVRLAEFVGALERADEGCAEAGQFWRCGQQLARESLHALIPATRGLTQLWHILPVTLAAMALQQTHTRFALSFEHGLATFEYQVLDAGIWPRARDAELTVGFIDALVRSAAPRDYEPADVRFEHGPDRHTQAVSAQLGVGVRYRARANAYSFPRALLLPAHTDPCASRLAAARLAELREALAQRERTRDTSARLREAILTELGSAQPLSQRRVAALCGASARTLRRQLAERGRTFRAEVASARLGYAHSALTLTDLPLSEITRRAGYSEQSALSRAVRAAFGASPTELRRRALRARAPRGAASQG
jgi:AraC-like DNA-binding protein